MFATFSVQHPVVLLAMLPVAAIILLSTGKKRAQSADNPPLNVFFAALKTSLRMTCIALLLLALSSPAVSVNRPVHNYSVFLLDISESIPPDAKVTACEKIRTIINTSQNQKPAFFLFAGKTWKADTDKAENFFRGFSREQIAKPADSYTGTLNMFNRIFYDYAYAELQKKITSYAENAELSGRTYMLKNACSALLEWKDSMQTSNSRLADALNTAYASMPESMSKKIFVFTDGFTDEDTAELAKLTSSLDDCKFFFDRLSDPADTDVIARKLVVPATIKVNEPFDASAEIFSTARCEADVSLFVNDTLLQTGKAVFTAPGTLTVNFPDIQLTQGTHTFRLLTETPNDSVRANNSALQIVSAQDKPRILIADYAQNASYAVREALEQQEFAVKVQTVPTGTIPLYALLDYDCVILFQPAHISTSQEIIFEKYVREYGGSILFVTGSNEAVAAEFHNTLTEQLLSCNFQDPAEMPPQTLPENPPDKGTIPSKAKAEAPTVAMLLIIDKSGSMEGTKIQLVKESAIATAEALYTEDLIGVIAFDSQAYEIVPLTPAREKDFIADKISRIVPDGGTDFYPALEMAFGQLSEIQAQIKHVVLLSDGHTALGNFRDIVLKMAQANITLTTIGISEDFDSGIMANLSQWGKGRFYFTYSLEEIPQIFTKETSRVLEIAAEKRPDTQPKPASRPDITPVSAPVMRDIRVIAADADEPVLKGIDVSALPPLKKIITVKPKNFSDTVLRSDTMEPVLILGRYGLGKTAVWAGDLDGTYSEAWLTWQVFPKFASAIIRNISRVSNEPSLQPSITLDIDRINRKITVSVFIPEEKNGQTSDPQFDCFYTVNGREIRCEMEHAGPALYRTGIAAEQTGVFYYFNMFINAKGFPGFTAKTGCIIDYPAEYYYRGVNEKFFGIFNNEPSAGVIEEKHTKQEGLNLSLYILIPALFLLLIDMSIKRT